MPRKKFSWKRSTGISKIKRKIARETGIPTTKSGRKKKIKKIATGGGCALVVLASVLIIIIVIFILRWFKLKEKDHLKHRSWYRVIILMFIT